MTEKRIPGWKEAGLEMARMRSRPQSEEMAEFWAKLDRLAAQGGGEEAVRSAMSPKSGAETHANVTWLRWKVLSDNADGRYSYAYAYMLNGLRDEKGADFLREAAVFFYHAKMALRVDGARCADRSSIESVIYGYETRQVLQPMIKRVSAMSEKERISAYLEAISLEEALGERKPQEVLCTQGVRTTLRALQQGQQPQRVESAEEQGKLNGAGRTFSIDTVGIEAELIPEQDWQQRRREILDREFGKAAKAF